MKAIIAAVDKEWGIGKNGKIPWYFPTDFAWFKEHTKNAVVIMGYNTFAEIAEKFKYPESGKLLPGRISYVISRKDIPSSKSVKIGFTSVQEATADAEANYPDRNIFYIGGAKIFEDAAPLVDRVYLTKIPNTYNCDTFFPEKTLFENNMVQAAIMTDYVPISEDIKESLVFSLYKKS